jgi:hypothetical protein
MACAKPPDPDRVTPPSQLRHPARSTASQVIRNMTELVRNRLPGADMQRSFSYAEWALRTARANGAPIAEIERLEAQIRNLKGEGHHQQRDALKGGGTDLLGRAIPKYASDANVRTLVGALSNSFHWAAKETRENLLRMIERNGRIPDAYRAQLASDVAKVLEVCPHAGGLARELTLRGQRGATGSASKLGSKSNAGIGAAYELMGTAALATKGARSSTPGAPPLYINTGRDQVTFGDKAFLNRRSRDGVTWRSPSRATIECDIRIARPEGLPGLTTSYREIGVDFKHVKEMGAKHASADFRNQVENVVEAIKDGQLHEYHFATNGTFGQGFRDVVAEANRELGARGETPIGLYEHVHTLVSDPSAQVH